MANDVLQDTENESAESMSQEEEMEQRQIAGKYDAKGGRLEEFRNFRISIRRKIGRRTQRSEKSNRGEDATTQ